MTAINTSAPKKQRAIVATLPRTRTIIRIWAIAATGLTAAAAIRTALSLATLQLLPISATITALGAAAATALWIHSRTAPK